MRVVVLSDSHGAYGVMRYIVTQQPDADAFLHLGDGEREFEDLAMEFDDKLMCGVRGNCDIASMGKICDIIILGGKKIFFTHGHTFGVKSGMDELKRESIKIGADIVLFGHTHMAVAEYEDGIYYMNPGSLRKPQYGSPSYGVIDITPAGIVTFIVNL